MANKIFLNPAEFQAEVSAFKTAVTGVSNVKASGLENLGKQTILDSMDKMNEAIELFKNVIETYVSFSEEDAQHLEALKQSWVTKDTQLGDEISGNLAAAGGGN